MKEFISKIKEEFYKLKVNQVRKELIMLSVSAVVLIIIVVVSMFIDSSSEIEEQVLDTERYYVVHDKSDDTYTFKAKKEGDFEEMIEEAKEQLNKEDLIIDIPGALIGKTQRYDDWEKQYGLTDAEIEADLIKQEKEVEEIKKYGRVSRLIHVFCKLFN